MNLAEFNIGAYAYKSGKLDATRQFHVLRRLGPVLGSFKDIEQAAKAGPEGAGLIAAIEPVMKAIAAMSDEDCNYVIGECLSVVQRQQSGQSGWANVWNIPARKPMFDDIDMSVMIQIVVKVLSDNYSNFFPVALRS